MASFPEHRAAFQEGAGPNSSWAPKYTQPQCERPDYQHNVYIPGTTSNYSMLKMAPRGDLDVYNTFSTFGKKKKWSHYDQSFERQEDLIRDAIFKWCMHDTVYSVISSISSHSCVWMDPLPINFWWNLVPLFVNMKINVIYLWAFSTWCHALLGLCPQTWRIWPDVLSSRHLKPFPANKLSQASKFTAYCRIHTHGYIL